MISAFYYGSTSLWSQPHASISIINQSYERVMAQKNQLMYQYKCDLNMEVEIFKSYFVCSAVLISSQREISALSCRSCARKRQIKHLIGSSLLGWWSFPEGVVTTPIYIVANVVAFFRNPLKKGPSQALNDYARRLMARDVIEHREAA